MTQIRFDVPLAAGTDPAVVEAFAKQLSEELNEVAADGPVAVEPLGADRSLAAVGSAIAVAFPIILNTITASEGILNIVEKLRELRDKADEAPEEQKPLLAALDPKDILVRVGRNYIPLNELTAEDLQGQT